MILCLADDLSGAAELAEIAAAKGLKSQVTTVVPQSCSADFLAIDAQTRSATPDTAARLTRQIIHETKRLNPTWIYKKTDSVLRGNIYAETEAIAETLEKDRILFIPANPELGRCIRGGEYWIDDQPLHRSIFGKDPQHPTRSSRVKQELGIPERTCVLDTGRADPPKERTWIIPDIMRESDLTNHVAEFSPTTLAAGAAPFFRALLDSHSPKSKLQSKPATKLRSPILWLCGSAAAWSQGIQEFATEHHVDIHTFQEISAWSEGVCRSLGKLRNTMMAIGSPRTPEGLTTDAAPEFYLSQLIDAAVPPLLSQAPRDILIEGGATASALLKRMDWKQLEAIPCFLRGLACLRPLKSSHRVRLFIKPGSYAWPEALWSGSVLSCGL